MSTHTKSLAELKAQAKALRRALSEADQTISHSQSLELLAQQLGHRDWNTLDPTIGNQPPMKFAVGRAVSGTYLSQPFNGKIIAMRAAADGQNYRLTIRFDQPVDVIPFDSMSNKRRQVNVTVGVEGRTVEKASNGIPQMVLEM